MVRKNMVDHVIAERNILASVQVFYSTEEKRRGKKRKEKQSKEKKRKEKKNRESL